MGINTEKSYNVKTRFWTEELMAGDYDKITSIETTLTQDGRQVVSTMSCPFELTHFTKLMKDERLAVGISSYKLGPMNYIDASCSSNTCSDSEMTISNLVWSSDDSVMDPEDIQ